MAKRRRRKGRGSASTPVQLLSRGYAYVYVSVLAVVVVFGIQSAVVCGSLWWSGRPPRPLCAGCADVVMSQVSVCPSVRPSSLFCFSGQLDVDNNFARRDKTVLSVSCQAVRIESRDSLVKSEQLADRSPSSCDI